MALTPTQKSSRLFKKLMGASETLVSRDFFEEPKLGRSSILPSQIWAESDKIPTTAPILSDGQTSGVVKYHDKLSLTHIAGSTDLSYFNINLIDAIPFNWGDGTYNYTLYKSDGTTQINFGIGDWLIDTDAGVLTFYGTLPSNVSSILPPKISFYKYVGVKGLVASGETGGIHVHSAVKLSTASGETISNYNASSSGYTSIPTTIDGVSGTTLLESDRILIKNQLNGLENGIFQVSGTTLVRAIDHDGSPSSEIAVGDYVFVLSGNTNKYTGWVLGSTNGNPLSIIPGVNTQYWEFFSSSQSYTADGKALQLNGNEFKVVLDESDSLTSGLEQNISSGLRIKPTILSTLNSLTGTSSLISSLEVEISGTSSLISSLETEISGNTISILSLETTLSSEISIRESADLSLETLINGLTGLTSGLSSEISIRESADLSLETAIINKSGVTAMTAGSGLSYEVLNQSLNVMVDNMTIKIIDNELRTPILWIQTDRLTTITLGTTGNTNISLVYEPVSHISAYVNGIEYLVSVTGGTSINPDFPFYFNNYPALKNDVLKFDSTVAGFGLESNTDLITIKYHYIDEVIY